jgi:ATPase
VIIAGTTGSGKSTFSQALAEYYAANNFVTKTVESPRDLILSDSITQYSKNLATSEEIHDILFLSRPDYIIFDEMRDTPDFKLFTDLRLGGSNVLGVLHAATPIDAVQRFIGRLETGMIPSVLDTLLFIEKGTVSKILTVQMIVKVPSGMTEADLARPVIEVKDYLSDKLEFEIYSYGEETVVIPVDEDFKPDPTKSLAAKQLEKELREYVDEVKVKLIASNRAEIYIPAEDIARIIGKEGKNIDKMEKEL